MSSSKFIIIKQIESSSLLGPTPRTHPVGSSVYGMEINTGRYAKIYLECPFTGHFNQFDRDYFAVEVEN